MANRNAFLTLFKHITRPQHGQLAAATVAATAERVPRITKPVVSAPMNGWSGPTLVAAVANHSGFPMYPIGYFTDPAKIIKDLQTIPAMLKDTDEFKDSTAKEFMPYGVGFITFWLDRQGPELLLSILRGEGDSSISHRPPAAVWFSFGDYRPYLKLIREHGAPGTRIIVQVQTVDEALAAQQDKVDVVVLQGTEAGGHGSQKAGPLINFIPEAKAALQNTLVSNPDAGLGMPALLAAGGISTAAQFKAAQALGADGVVIGTGFMPTFESPGPQRAKERLLQTSDGGLNTVKTRIFDELREFCWPEGFDGRVVRNVVTDREDEDHQRDHWRHEGEAAFKVLREDRTGTKQDWIKATAEQDYNILPLWSGTGVGLLKKQTSVAEFMDQLLDERA